jgi:hypothetical protein
MRASVGKRAAGMLAAAAGGAALLGLPAVSSALDAGQAASSLTTSAKAAPAPVSASVQGSNPHGQGTAVSVSVAGKEAVVVGRSRGEQRSDGSYHGHTTTLGVLGNDVIANDTGPGQTAKGPLAPVQEQVLDQVCSGSSGNACVDVLRADSATTGSGSTNHSRLAGVTLGGANGVSATAADSNGNIQSNGDCQQAHGDMTLLNLMLGGNLLLNIGQSASDSNSCPAGTTVTNSTNPLVTVAGQPIPLPGCGANSSGNLVDLSPLLTIACNAGAATGAGGVVNDGLAGTLLPGPNGPVATLSAAGTGAAAQPARGGVLGVRQSGGSSPATSTKKTNSANGASPNTGGENGQTAPASAKATQPLTAAQADKLPYTGSDVVLALFIASCLLAAGLGLRGLTGRTDLP